MNLEQLKKIIINENLEFYLDFYIGGIKDAENCLSMAKTGENKYHVRKTGERGMKKDYFDLSEDMACKTCLKFLRNAKLIYDYEKKNKNEEIAYLRKLKYKHIIGLFGHLKINDYKISGYKVKKNSIEYIIDYNVECLYTLMDSLNNYILMGSSNYTTNDFLELKFEVKNDGTITLIDKLIGLPYFSSNSIERFIKDDMSNTEFNKIINNISLEDLKKVIIDIFIKVEYGISNKDYDVLEKHMTEELCNIYKNTTNEEAKIFSINCNNCKILNAIVDKNIEKVVSYIDVDIQYNNNEVNNYKFIIVLENKSRYLNKCFNCGASIQNIELGKCIYCGTNLSNDKFVISNINLLGKSKKTISRVDIQPIK